MSWLARLAGLRPEDFRRVWPLSLSYALVMAALYVLKPVRNALFLDRFGVEQLPPAMILVAVGGALTAAGYGYLARSIRIDRLVLGMFVVLSACLAGFRLVLPLGYDNAYYAFYVWVALYGLVATSLLWQLANVRFNPREARRLFGAIGTGGTLGAVFGGLLTSTLADRLGTENLVLVAAALVVGAWACLRAQATGPSASVARADASKRAGGMSSIRSSRLLSWMALTAAVVGVVAVVVDVQFNDAVERRFPSKDQKTVFFGQFFACFNILALFAQLALTRIVLKSLGVAWALLVLPAALSLGSLALVLAPGLLSAAALKLADGSLRHSIHRSAFEILLIPVPVAVKKQVKLVLDATIDSAATALGAALVMFFVHQLGVSYVALTAVSFVFLGIWLVCIWGLRGAYVDTLGQALATRKLDTTDLTINIAEAGAVDTLIEALDEGDNARRAAYVLDILASVRDPRLPQRVRPFLRHSDPEVRARALRVLAAQDVTPEVVEEVSGLLEDSPQDVRGPALRLVNVHSEAGSVVSLETQLVSQRPSLRVAALGAIAASGAREEQALVTPGLIDDLLADDTPEGENARVSVATALGSLDRPDLLPYWERLRHDPSEQVVRQTIRSAARDRHPSHIPWLFELLSDRRHRMEARLAIASYGASMVDELDRRLGDADLPEHAWRVSSRILARIDSQRSVDVLAKHAKRQEWGRRRMLLEALTKLRNRFEELRFDAPEISELLFEEIEACAFHSSVMRLLPPAAQGDPAMRLFATTLTQRREEALARAFSLLALRYPTRDLAGAHRALVGGRPAEAASALEFLDNVLTRREVGQLFAVVDPDQQRPPGDGGERLAAGRSAPGSLFEAVRAVMARSDAWLRACALYAMRACEAQQLQALQALAIADEDPIVRETGAALARASRRARPLHVGPEP